MTTTTTSVCSQTTADDDSSIVSMLSNTICRQFPWLSSSSNGNHGTNGTNTALDEEYLEEKQFEILDCLNGVHEEVDLWQLRTLALSKGGLVSSSMRKRAWPKLVGAHVQILHQSKYRLCAVSNSSLKALHRDVESTLWNVEEQVNKAKEYEQQRPGGSSTTTNATTTTRRSRRVRGSTKRKTHIKQHEDKRERERERDSCMVPDLAPAVSNETSSGDEGTLSNQDSSFSSNHSFESNTTPTDDDSHSLHSTTASSTTATSHHHRRRRPTNSTEQKVLFNIIVSVLRMMPPDSSPYWEDDRFKMFSGLSDVGALLLMNLESPSLTSLVLGRLAETQSLRDSMRPIINNGNTNTNTNPMETVVQVVLTPLLQRVDGPLAAHIMNATTLSSFAIPWIKCWFCQSFSSSDEGVALASRLIDVFIASHPMMPVYFTVAVLTYYRSVILSTNNQDDGVKTMKSTLSNLLTNVSMDALEGMIEVALSYLSRFSPTSWIDDDNDDNAKNNNRRLIPMVHMLQIQPPWPSVAPTDYALLQQAKAMRQSGRTLLRKRSDHDGRHSNQQSQQPQYLKARAATGQQVIVLVEHKNKLKHLMMLLIFAAVGIIVWMSHDGPSSSSVLVDTMRAAAAAAASSSSSTVGGQQYDYGASFSGMSSLSSIPLGRKVETTTLLSSSTPTSKSRKKRQAQDNNKAAAEALARRQEIERKQREITRLTAASKKKQEATRRAAKTSTEKTVETRTTTKQAGTKSSTTTTSTTSTVMTTMTKQLNHYPSMAPVLASAFQPTSVQQKLAADKKEVLPKYRPFRFIFRGVTRFFSILFGGGGGGGRY